MGMSTNTTAKKLLLMKMLVFVVLSTVFESNPRIEVINKIFFFVSLHFIPDY